MDEDVKNAVEQWINGNRRDVLMSVQHRPAKAVGVYAGISAKGAFESAALFVSMLGHYERLEAKQRQPYEPPRVVSTTALKDHPAYEAGWKAGYDQALEDRR